MAGPGIGCNDRVFSSGYIPQPQAIDAVVSHEVQALHPVGYSKPVETIREEEYPHMNKGNLPNHHSHTATILTSI